MKKIILVTMMIFSNFMFSQEFEISEFEKCGNNDNFENVILQIQHKNVNATVLKLNNRNYLSFGDTIYKYHLLKRDNIFEQRKKLSNAEASLCKNLLDTLKSIEPNLLNVIQNEKGEKISVEDGVNYQLELFKKNCSITYSSYSPHIYIEHKFPHYREREKLLLVYKQLSQLFHNEEYDKLKNCDTLFLVRNIFHELKELKMNINTNNGITTYTFLFSNSATLNLKTSKKEKMILNKKFIEGKKVLNLDEFNKYQFDSIIEILSKKKIIYIIEKGKNLKKNKLLIYRAYLNYYR